MRAALATTAIVLCVLVVFFWDRLAPSFGLGSREPAPLPEVAAPPPVADFPGERDATATPRTWVVREGDTLRSIAVEAYGDGSRADAIFEANRDRIEDPAHLRAGRELVLP